MIFKIYVSVYKLLVYIFVHITNIAITQLFSYRIVTSMSFAELKFSMC